MHHMPKPPSPPPPPPPPPPRVIYNEKPMSLEEYEKMKNKESWVARFKRTWGVGSYEKDAENLASYNPCGGYQPRVTNNAPKNPPSSRGLPEVSTSCPMPKVKPPKDEDSILEDLDFYNEQIIRYERVYVEAIRMGVTPDDAKRHADNVVSQAILLRETGSIQIEAPVGIDNLSD